MPTEPLRVAKGPEHDLLLLPALANRHGLVAGATGTGKTVTLRVLAEGFSRIGVPVFLADVKGDLSGLARPGGDSEKILARARDEYLSAGYPIGSGVAEGACRHVVKDRMEQTGMRWTVDGAQAMLHLRSIYLNSDWDEFVEYRIQAEQTTLYGKRAA
jgi:hypothetical protein